MAAPPALLYSPPSPAEPLPFSSALEFPRPAVCSDETQIPFLLSNAAPTRLAVYDAAGREVAVLVDAVQAAGRYLARLDAAALPPGTYTCELETQGYVASRKLQVRR